MEDRFRFRAWKKIKQSYDYDIQECQKIPLHNSNKEKCFACFQSYLDNQDILEIEQCTGLKDKNGKLIYEGDIVSVIQFYNGIPTSKKRPCKVSYKYGRFNIHDINQMYLEVIGNIHENKELVGG